MKLIMMVTNDKYELPMAVSDTVSDLSAMTGKTKMTIAKALSRSRRGYVPKGKFRFVEVEVDEC